MLVFLVQHILEGSDHGGGGLCHLLVLLLMDRVDLRFMLFKLFDSLLVTLEVTILELPATELGEGLLLQFDLLESTCKFILKALDLALKVLKLVRSAIGEDAIDTV